MAATVAIALNIADGYIAIVALDAVSLLTSVAVTDFLTFVDSTIAELSVADPKTVDLSAVVAVKTFCARKSYYLLSNHRMIYEHPKNPK